MTKKDFLASYKYSVLQHARKHNNITDAMQGIQFIQKHISKKFKKLGSLGL